MTTIAKKRELFPTRISDLFEPSGFFGSSLPLLRNKLFDWDWPESIPSVNITENDSEYLLELAAPGLEKKDFKIETDNHNLTISAEKTEESEKKTKKYQRQEYSYNSFSRSFTLPENTLPNNISAKYNNGVLEVTVPKKAPTKGESVTKVEVK